MCTMENEKIGTVSLWTRRKWKDGENNNLSRNDDLESDFLLFSIISFRSEKYLAFLFRILMLKYLF